MENFQTRLRYLRSKCNLTQAQVADFNHLIRVTYAGYEVGRCEPDISTLIRLADFYNVSLDYLLGVTPYSFKMFTY